MHVGRIFASASALALGALLATPVVNADSETTVQTVRLDPHGRPDGVILADGTELVGRDNEKLVRVAGAGDPVRVELASGDRIIVVNTRTTQGATVGPRAEVDLAPLYALPLPVGIGGGPPAQPYPRIDDATSLERFAVVTRISQVLKAPNGAPAGLLLEDGTQAHVVPRLSGVLARLTPGTPVRVEGLGTRGQRGSSMWVLSITNDRYVYLDAERGVGAPEINVEARTAP